MDKIKYCTNCGNPDNQDHKDNCVFNPRRYVCDSCNCPVGGWDKFCENCGEKIKNNLHTKSEEREHKFSKNSDNKW